MQHQRGNSLRGGTGSPVQQSFSQNISFQAQQGTAYAKGSESHGHTAFQGSDTRRQPARAHRPRTKGGCRPGASAPQPLSSPPCAAVEPSGPSSSPAMRSAATSAVPTYFRSLRDDSKNRSNLNVTPLHRTSKLPHQDATSATSASSFGSFSNYAFGFWHIAGLGLEGRKLSESKLGGRLTGLRTGDVIRWRLWRWRRLW